MTGGDLPEGYYDLDDRERGRVNEELGRKWTADQAAAAVVEELSGAADVIRAAGPDAGGVLGPIFPQDVLDRHRARVDADGRNAAGHRVVAAGGYCAPIWPGYEMVDPWERRDDPWDDYAPDLFPRLTEVERRARAAWSDLRSAWRALRHGPPVPDDDWDDDDW